MRYIPHYTPEFKKQVDKHSNLKHMIKRKVELLLDDPYFNSKSEPLHHQLKGLRNARVIKNIRLIFAVCEEVKSFVHTNIVSVCKKFGGKTVIFITMGVHEDVY